MGLWLRNCFAKASSQATVVRALGRHRRLLVSASIKGWVGIHPEDFEASLAGVCAPVVVLTVADSDDWSIIVYRRAKSVVSFVSSEPSYLDPAHSCSTPAERKSVAEQLAAELDLSERQCARVAALLGRRATQAETTAGRVAEIVGIHNWFLTFQEYDEWKRMEGQKDRPWARLMKDVKGIESVVVR